MAGEKKPLADEVLHDEEKLRRYLLGTCTPDEANDIDRSILSEDSQPILEVVEDELIEDYITGELDEPDRRRFEGRLLRSNSIAKKIQISALLLGRQDAAREITRRIEAEAATASATPIEESASHGAGTSQKRCSWGRGQLFLGGRALPVGSSAREAHAGHFRCGFDIATAV